MRAIDAHQGPVLAVGYLPDQRIVSTGWDKTVVIWDVAEGVELARWPTEHAGLWVAGSPDGQYVAIASRAGFDLWNLATDRPLERLAATGGPLAWSRGGYSLAVGWGIWSVGHRTHHQLSGLGNVLASTFHEDGRLLFVTENSLYQARPPAWRMTRQTLSGPTPVAVAIHPQAAWLASGMADGRVTLQSTTSNHTVPLVGHTNRILGCVFSADGRLLLTASLDGIVRLWDTSDWRERNCFDWQISTIRGLALAPDGMTAVVAGFDGTLLVWDLE